MISYDFSYSAINSRYHLNNCNFGFEVLKQLIWKWCPNYYESTVYCNLNLQQLFYTKFEFYLFAEIIEKCRRQTTFH